MIGTPHGLNSHNMRKSPQYISKQPAFVILGKKMFLDFESLQGLPTSAIANIAILKIEAQEIDHDVLDALVDMRITTADGQTMQAGSQPCKSCQMIVKRDVASIEVAFTRDENWIKYIRFYYRDGSIGKLGFKTEDYRVERFQLQAGEQLLGVELDVSQNFVQGVTWIVWSPN